MDRLVGNCTPGSCFWNPAEPCAPPSHTHTHAKAPPHPPSLSVEKLNLPGLPESQRSGSSN